MAENSDVFMNSCQLKVGQQFNEAQQINAMHFSALKLTVYIKLNCSGSILSCVCVELNIECVILHNVVTSTLKCLLQYLACFISDIHILV